MSKVEGGGGAAIVAHKKHYSLFGYTPLESVHFPGGGSFSE